MNNKISSNIGLNLFSYIFFAISGILLNIIVGIYYDAATLGVFNTVYAMYILLSQVCVFGQNFTILSFVSNDFDKKIRKEYLINSLFLTVSVSLMACLLLYFMAPLFGIIFNSIKVATGIKIVVIALPAFAINKILTGYLNGTKNLKAFAFFRTLRMVLIALFMYIICLLKINGSMIGIVFPMAEYLLVIMTIIYMHNEIDIKSYKLSIVKEFYHFGLQAMPIGLIAEINTRIDILCLNLFLSDSIVGLYSFALLFAEGIYQIYIVIRQVINPYIAEYRQQYGYKYKDFFKKQLITINYAIAFLGGIIASYIYIWGTNNIFTKYIRSNDIFIILLVGIIINSYFIILSNYFVQSKKPLIESNISLIVVVSNVILDLSLIPSFGLEGAAIATSISYCIASLMQVFYANKLKI